MAQALRAHWIEQVPWLGACAVAADIGSGPAVLARMLANYRGADLAGLHWICIDSAHWPGAREALQGARLTLRTGENFADALPPPGGVDALLSNFGLEYVDQQAAAEACWAWLAGGARLHAVIHARGSVIDRAASANLADIGCALHEVRLFDRASAMLQALATAPADPVDRMMHAMDVRDAYNDAVNVLKARMQAAGSRSAPLVDMLQGITVLAARVREGHLGAALEALNARAAAYGAEHARLEAMRRAALDEAGLSALVEALSRAGLRQVQTRPLDSGLGQVAWAVVGRKP